MEKAAENLSTIRGNEERTDSMDDCLMLLCWGVVFGLGFAFGTAGVGAVAVIFIKFLAYAEYKFFGGKHAKKTTVRCSKDGAHGNAGGVLPPEK